MNYLKHYIKLIRNSQKRISPMMGENHHIFPQSIFGSNSNTVRLTYREHFLAHLLLLKIYERRYGKTHINTFKMLNAVLIMGWSPANASYTRYVNNRLYASAREDFISRCMIGESNPAKRDDVREKISNAKRGRDRPDMKGKSYFGASVDRIIEGTRKMVEKKTGMKNPNYPKNRKKKDKTGPNKNIAASLRRKKEEIINMTAEQFNNWIIKQSLYARDGKRKNSNVCRAILLRNEKIETYYGIS